MMPEDGMKGTKGSTKETDKLIGTGSLASDAKQEVDAESKAQQVGLQSSSNDPGLTLKTKNTKKKPDIRNVYPKTSTTSTSSTEIERLVAAAASTSSTEQEPPVVASTIVSTEKEPPAAAAIAPSNSTDDKEPPAASKLPPRAPTHARKQSSQSNMTTAKHHRVVSWGAAAPPTLYDTASIFDTLSVDSPIRGLSLEDIAKTSPLETEAETLILHAIEHQQALRARANTGCTSSSTILSNVPDSAMELLIDDPDSLRKQDSLTPNKKLPKVALTREETLAGLTKELAAMNPTISSSSPASSAASATNAPPQGGAAWALPRNVVGAAGTLVHDASLILRPRMRRNKSDEQQQHEQVGKEGTTVMGQDEDEGTTVGENQANRRTTAGNWGLVKSAVAGTSAFRTHKDNDDNCPMDDLNGGVGVGEYSARLDVEAGQQTPTTPPTDEWEDDNRSPQNQRKMQFWRRSLATSSPVAETKGFLYDFYAFVKQRRRIMQTYCRLLLFILVPATGVAAILFYLADNPPTGIVDLDKSNSTFLVNESGAPIDVDRASASWWILFVCVRHITVFALARCMQVLVIDFFCVGSRIAIRTIGQMLTLFVVQSKGWPFQLTMWSILSFGLLSGESQIAQHWGFWQDTIGLFNEHNPSGSIPSDDWYRQVLAIAVSVGFLVSLKRLMLGFYLGGKISNNYGEDLTKVMKKIVLLSKVGILARKLAKEEAVSSRGEHFGRQARCSAVAPLGISSERFHGLIRSTVDKNVADFASEEEQRAEPSVHTLGDARYIVDPFERGLRGGLTSEQKMRVDELLGNWDEPLKESGSDSTTSLSSILQFRTSLACLESPYMFSIPWGVVSTRENMIISTQDVYKRLNLRTPDTNTAHFDVLAQAALDDEGVLDVEVLEDLIRLLRPDRDGNLSLLDFVKSVDAVYKEAKLLRAAVYNGEKIDRAFENMINVVFYALIGIIILNQLGFDPLALFLSLSSIIVAFAFMVGSASSKMFEGWLFILLRRPYDVGDRIHVSDVNTDTSSDGSPGWIVQDVTLHTTTVVFGSTNERATISNGSMASSRVINMTRSVQAILTVKLRFATSAPFEKIQILEEAVRNFVLARPREWANFIGFRASQIVADLGYVEYVLILRHRESWGNIGTVLSSKAEVSLFCHELSKKMDMRYKSPPMPVHLAFMNSPNMVPSINQAGSDIGDDLSVNFKGVGDDPAVDFRAIATMFEHSQKLKDS